VVPWLSALDEDVCVEAKPTWIVEGANSYPDDIGPARDLNVKWASALTTENARNLVAGIRLGAITPRRPAGNAEFSGRHAHRGNVWRSTLPLAVTAVALQRELWFATAFIAHGAAQASTSSYRHTNLLLQRVSMELREISKHPA
jgi:hypothetical protein